MQQQYPPYSAAPQTNSQAIISLITGLLSFVLFPLISAIVAIITGNNALREIRASNGMQTGEGMAQAGRILGWINVILISVSVCVIAALLLLSPNISDIFNNITNSI